MAKSPATQASSHSARTTWRNAKNTQPAPGITSAAISASIARGNSRGPRTKTPPGLAPQGADPRACGRTSSGSGRSVMMPRRSPKVFAPSAAEIRSSSSSEESRPCAKCSRNRSATCSRSASETRIRSSIVLPALYFRVPLVLVWLVVVGEDPVELAAGPLQQPFRGPDLLGRAGVSDLHDPAAQPGRLGEQARHLPVLLLGGRLPGAARHLGVLLHVLAARIGEPERAPAAGLLAHDQALVGELRQRGVHRSGTRTPGSAAALLDLRHDLVAIARAFPQQCQNRGPHVAAPRLRTPRRACRTRRSRPPAAPLPAEAAAPVARAFPAAGLPVPRRAAPVAARRGPGAAPYLAEQVGRASEYLEQAAVEVTRAPGCCRHNRLPVSRDMITIYRQSRSGFSPGQVMTRSGTRATP